MEEKKSTYKGYTAARNEASKKYNKAHLEQVAIRVKKGMKDRYLVLAEVEEKSLAGLITGLLDAEIDRHEKRDYILQEAEKRAEQKKKETDTGVISASRAESDIE